MIGNFEDWYEGFNLGDFEGRLKFPNNDFDIQFAYNDFKGSDILSHNFSYVSDLLGSIELLDLVNEKPFFACKELNNVLKEIYKIKNSPYCVYAKDKGEIIELANNFENYSKNMKHLAYSRLEWEI